MFAHFGSIFRSFARWRPRLGRGAFLWAAVLSLLVGITGFGDPLDLTLGSLRDKIRSQPVSGEVVAVGIDRQAMNELGPAPWDRRDLARLNERLFEAGASRVFYNLLLQGESGPHDADLVASVRAHPGRVFVAATMESGVVGNSEPILPFPALAESAEVLSVNKWITFWNGVDWVPYQRLIGGAYRRSMEAVIAGVEGGPDEAFPVDYSYQVDSIPYWSAVQFLGEDGQLPDLAGRDVVVGPNDASFGDIYTVIGQDHASGMFIIVLGAETLRSGKPVSLGWLPLWAACLGVFFLLRDRIGSGRTLAAALAMLPGAFGIALILESANIFVALAPGLVFALIVLACSVWARMARKKRKEGSTNPISGLPTFNALLQNHQASDDIVIGAHFDNLANIVSTLPPRLEGQIVQQVAGRLGLGIGSAQLLQGDAGDFLWLVPAAGIESAIEQFAAIDAFFRSPILVEDKRFDTNVTFGVNRDVSLPLSHRVASVIAAAREAREQGVLWKQHDADGVAEKEWALSIIGELDEAIERRDVWVAFQPQVDMTTRKIVGAEALVRWTHRTRGPINPAEFVAAAERRGRIDRLTEFVLEESCRCAEKAKHYSPGFGISVNLSVALLTQRGIVRSVAAVLARHEIAPSDLTLEITETVAFKDKAETIAIIEDLRDLGVKISIDDFGTGQSSLDYLREIPANELKIDRSFTAKMLKSNADQAVVKSIIDLAHTLSITVVAEGVEHEEELEFLSALGCDVSQGYLTGRPVEAGDLVRLLAPRERLRATG